jgi:hypothetical protein
MVGWTEPRGTIGGTSDSEGEHDAEAGTCIDAGSCAAQACTVEALASWWRVDGPEVTIVGVLWKCTQPITPHHIICSSLPHEAK